MGHVGQVKATFIFIFTLLSMSPPHQAIQYIHHIYLAAELCFNYHTKKIGSGAYKIINHHKNTSIPSFSLKA